MLQSTDPVQLRTARQVCKQLGQVSHVTLWRRIRDPKLEFPQPLKIAGRLYFRDDEIDAWIEAQADDAVGKPKGGK